MSPMSSQKAKSLKQSSRVIKLKCCLPATLMLLLLGLISSPSYSRTLVAGTQTPALTLSNSEPLTQVDARRLVTFTVSVSGGSSIPTGTVIFVVNGLAGNPINLGNGAAATQAVLNAGDHTITARYSGDATYAAAEKSTMLTIRKLGVFTTNFPTNPVAYGETAGFSYRFTVLAGMVTTAFEGSSTAYVDGVQFATGLPNAGSISIPNLSVGTHQVLISIVQDKSG